MTLIVYNDPTAVAVIIEDPNGGQFYNSLLAKASDTVADAICILEVHKGYEVVTDKSYSEFHDEFGFPHGQSQQETIESLNIVFTNSGAFSAPVITSPTTVSAIDGGFFSYELEAVGGVSYEWENIPEGLNTVDGNVRTLIGTLSEGTYNLTMRAMNYFGVDERTLTINVIDDNFVNERSISFRRDSQSLQAETRNSDVFVRAGDGDGSSDAWSISFWVKLSRMFTTEQEIFYYGSPVTGRLKLKHTGFLDDRIVLEYGTNNNSITVPSDSGFMRSGNWCHVLVSYDGSSTASNGNGFSIFVNGTDVTGTPTGSYSGDITQGINRLGLGLMRQSKLDEVAYYSEDVSSLVPVIYNLGKPNNLNNLATTPTNWIRCGDLSIYPTIRDAVGDMNYVMTNMAPRDISNDTPDNTRPALVVNRQKISIKLGQIFFSKIFQVIGTPEPSLTAVGTFPNNTSYDSANKRVTGLPLTKGSGSFTYTASNTVGDHIVVVDWEVI